MRLLLSIVLLIASAPVVVRPQAVPDPPRHVILISIDGFAAYHLENAALELPNIRALAAAGTRATYSETVFPSLTHPSHTTLITGVTPQRHGVVHNRVRDRRTDQRTHITNLPRSESVRVPTIFDAVHAKGWRNAAFFWPETKDDASVHDNFAEVFDANEMADPKAIAPSLLSELRAAGIPIDSYFAHYDDPFGQGASDITLTRAAAHVFKTRRPALTAVHLLMADKVQHEYGAEHYLSAAALTTMDHCVGLLRAAVKEAGLSDRVTFIVAADHGFATVKHDLNLSPVLRDPELDPHINWRDDNWYVFGELKPSFERGRHGAALERVLARAAKTSGVSRIVRPGEFGAIGYPEYGDNHFVPGQYLIAGDIETHLLLDDKDVNATRRLRARPYHGHGFFPEHPKMRTLLVLSGSGVVKGGTIGAARNIDVAPTIASLLGLSLPSATGTPLTAALSR